MVAPCFTVMVLVAAALSASPLALVIITAGTDLLSTPKREGLPSALS